MNNENMVKKLNNLPLVSVIIPNYNNARYLSDSIDSVLQQDYPNIELIIIDDGSTDESLNVLEKYKDIAVIIQQNNKGAAAARNTGLKYANGEFIAFLDSDDLWLKGKLKAQVMFLLDNSDYIACFTNWEVFNSKEVISERIQSLDCPKLLEVELSGWLYLALLKKSIISTISILIRANIVRNVGFFNENYNVGEDHDYWIRLSRHGLIAKIANTYALYRFNFDSITKKPSIVNFSLKVLESNVQKFGLCDPSGKCISKKQYLHYLSERHFTYGYHCFWSGEKCKSQHSFLQCIKNGHFIYKSLRYLLLSYIPFFYQYLIKRHVDKWSKQKPQF